LWRRRISNWGHEGGQPARWLCLVSDLPDSAARVIEPVRCDLLFELLPELARASRLTSKPFEPLPDARATSVLLPWVAPMEFPIALCVGSFARYCFSNGVSDGTCSAEHNNLFPLRSRVIKSNASASGQSPALAEKLDNQIVSGLAAPDLDQQPARSSDVS